MGLIKAGIGAVGSALADTWKEYFSCDSLDKDVLVVRGHKQISSRSSNTKGNDNVISDGSGISVADGQCMIIVEGGKVVEFCAEPGIFTYHNDTAPSLFEGNLGESIKKTFSLIGKRFTYGGDVGNDQRVYYFNTKEILDNKFGTPNPIPFKIVDQRANFDLDLHVRCSGEFSYKIIDPILFYTNVCGNVTSDYSREEIDGQIKAEFIGALQGGFGKVSAKGVRPSEIYDHTGDVEESMNEQLAKKWVETRGIQVASIAFQSVTLPDEDQAKLNKYQEAISMSNPAIAAGRTQAAYANAMENAADNEGGSAMGFMGMGMAMNAGANMGASGSGSLYGMAQQANSQKGTWKCECGTENSGKFCSNCGKAQVTSWKCECGTENTGKFCSNCGKARP